MVKFIFSRRKRQQLISDAMSSRANDVLRLVALCLVVFYNVVGLLDIFSTVLAIETGVAEEANPLMRYLMEEIGVGWVAVKLTLQFMISAMVLWFPHRYVLLLFAATVAGNSIIVANNFLIALTG
ncbi:MAG: DUF5658 family protein [Pseudomonadota bacterium]